jgi:hypothetical protein
MYKNFSAPYISVERFDSTAIEAGSSVDEKLKGHGPEAVSLLILRFLVTLLSAAHNSDHR